MLTSLHIQNFRAFRDLKLDGLARVNLITGANDAGKTGLPHGVTSFRCLAQNTPRNIYPTKAKFRAWMASQSDFDLRTGKAAQGGYLPWESEAFEPLRAFLSAL